MDKVTKTQQIECLFGHHDFFERGILRQCRRCKMLQMFTPPNGKIGGTKPEWCDIGISEYDLKEATLLQEMQENAQRNLRKIDDTTLNNDDPVCVTTWPSTCYNWFAGVCATS